MRFACWITEAANTHSVYVILTVFSTAAVATRTRLNFTFIRTLLVVLHPNNFGNCKKAHTEYLLVQSGNSCSSVSLQTVAIGLTASVIDFKENTFFIRNWSCVPRSTFLCLQVWLSYFHDEFVSFPRNWQWPGWLRYFISFYVTNGLLPFSEEPVPTPYHEPG